MSTCSRHAEWLWTFVMTCTALPVKKREAHTKLTWTREPFLELLDKTPGPQQQVHFVQCCCNGEETPAKTVTSVGGATH